jgi:predicted secreted Zn-dependent protease
MSVVIGDPEWRSEPLDGASLAVVAETIAGMAEAGKTEWFPRWSYETTGDAVSSVAITVEIRVTLPVWRAYGAASEAEKNEWDRFCRALRAHEQGHVDLVHDTFSDLDGRMVGQTVGDATEAWHDAQTALQSASDAYDDSTDHGRSSGTVMDLDAGSADAS